MATIPPTRKPAKPISEKTRAADEVLRKRLENISDKDMKEFDEALGKAIKPKKDDSGGLGKTCKTGDIDATNLGKRD